MPHPSLRDLKNLVLSLREYALNHLLIVLRPDESVLLMKRVQRMTIVLLSVALYASQKLPARPPPDLRHPPIFRTMRPA